MSKQPLKFDDTWEVIKAYFKDEGFVNDTIRSFDKFIGNLNNIPIPTIEVQADNVNSNHKNTMHVIKFTKAHVGKAMLNEDDPNKKATFLSHPKSRNKADNITLLTSHEAQERSLTLSLPIYYDIVHEVYKKTDEEGSEYKLQTRKSNNKVSIGDIPFPKGSEWDNINIIPSEKKHECPYQRKGVFIVNGMEKIVIPQARMEYNSTFVFRKTGNKPYLVAEVRSLGENDYSDPAVITIKFKAFKGRGDEIFKLKFPYGQYEINIVAIFRALGIQSDKEISDMILQGSGNPKMLKALQASLEEKEGMSICSQKDGLLHIGKKQQSFGDKNDEQSIMNYASNLLCRDLFPHMGKTKDDFRQKAFYLGYMAHKILRVHLGLTEPDNRDHCARKRFELVGPLLEDLYCEIMGDLTRDIKAMLGKWIRDAKPIQDISTLLKKRSISQKFRYVIGTGNWTCNTNKRTNKTGVTAVLSRLSYASALSHMRRLNTPIGREGKLSKPRQLQWDSWGMIDPSETPEGGNVGLVNNFSLVAHVSMGDSSYHLMDIVNSCDLKPLEKCKPAEDLGTCRVFVNGKWVGMVAKAHLLLEKLRSMKRTLDINYETGISYKLRERSIFINTDSGRVMRPLLVVKEQKPLLTKERVEQLKGKLSPRYKDSYTALMADGLMEFLDVSEEDNAMIAMYIKDLEKDSQYTHCEIHPCLIYGEIAGSIPYSNHNPSPRITFQAAMGKQPVGVPMMNFNERMDTMLHVLNYPQKPVTFTKISELTGMDDMGSGAEAIVLIASLEGYNVEDAIYINRRSLDFGMFRSIFYRTYKDVEQKLGNHYSEEFKKPNRDKCFGMRPGSYEKLGEDGIIGVGEHVSSDDALIGKTSAYVGTEKNNKFSERDHSTINRSNEHGIVDRVLITTNEDGFRFVKVRVRSLRIPTVGDKFSSRHGQKGVIGNIKEPEDMPFSVKSGIVPDIIINPHAKPSRMTIAMILEMLSGKIGCITGQRFDATSFEDCDESEETTQKKLEDMLVKLGYPRGGEEMFIDGTTGKMFQAPLFIGTCYYQRLKHMVDDKIHCLTPDHEVLTWKGWKNIVDVTKDDKIASLQDGKLVYDLPSNVFEYDYNGKLYHISNQQLNLMVTPTHKMWTAVPSGTTKKEWIYGLREARNIFGKHVKYQKDAAWDKDDYQFILKGTYTIGEPDVAVDMNAWLTFFGIWIAEGWTDVTDRTIIVVNKQSVIETLVPAIEKLGFRYYISFDEKMYIINSPLWHYMIDLGVSAVNKRLPSWVWKLSSRQARLLLDSMILRCGRSVRYYTNSIGLADDVQRLCLHAGWSGIKYKHSDAANHSVIGGRHVYFTADDWSIEINKTENNPAVNYGHSKVQDIQTEEWINYEGKVYCVEVPGNIFYVRRNGKSVWTGNSRSKGPVHIMTRQPIDGRLRDGGLRFGEMERDCSIAHGGAIMLNRRMMKDSDECEVYYCSCGHFAYKNAKTKTYHCSRCVKGQEIKKMNVPYVWKLMNQELMAMGIRTRMEVSESNECNKY